jgi:hypothetical protein
MPGSLLQLVAKGAQDNYLTGNPQISFFKYVYKRHTNYSLENRKISYEGEAFKNGIGQTIDIKIPREGDLLHMIYITVELPEIPEISRYEDAYHILGLFQPQFFNSVGHLLINNVVLEIGGQEICKQTGEWMEIWSQLSYDEAKQLGFKYMIGRVNNDNIQTYNDKPRGPLFLQIPLQFWFCKNIGSALPLVALQFHSINIKVTFNNIDSIISQGIEYYLITQEAEGGTGAETPNIRFKNIQVNNNFKDRKIKYVEAVPPVSGGILKTVVAGPYNNEDTYFTTRNDKDPNDLNNTVRNETITIPEIISLTPQNIQTTTRQVGGVGFTYTGITETINAYKANQFKVEVLADYVYLDTYERQKMAKSKHLLLIEQVQDVSNRSITKNSTKYNFTIKDLNHPIKSLYWFLKPNSTIYKNIYPFNFSNSFTGDYVNQDDPIKTCTIRLNNIDRVEARNGKYYRLTQPFQHHTRNSTLFVYMYSFCLRPEDLQPTGSCNFSRIDNIQLDIDLNLMPHNNDIKLYALNYNFLKIENGMGGLQFSN